VKRLERALALWAVLFVLGCGTGIAAGTPAVPLPFHPSSGGVEVPAGKAGCWSEPPDLNGMVISSEEISAFGLVSEVANDSVPPCANLNRVVWWGGYWNNTTPCEPGIETPGFNIRLYADAASVPGDLIAELTVVPGGFTEEKIGCQSEGIPLYRWSAEVSLEVVPDVPIWFSVQMLEHSFTPQWGRLAAGAVTGAPTMFRSDYFEVSDWTSASAVFDTEFEASQEFDCCETPARTTTWGAVKALYR
jgi:hypothetical protein